jgi:ABC-type transporter Mla subunit MlaD
MEALKTEARAALDVHMDNKKKELVHALQAKLDKFESGNYTDDLRKELDAIKAQTEQEITAAREAQAQLQAKIDELKGLTDQLGEDGEALKVLAADMEAKSGALQERLDAVRSKVLNFSDMAGKTLAGSFKRLIGLP